MILRYVKLLSLILVVGAFSRVFAEELMLSKGPYQVFVYYECEAADSWILRMAAVNEYGQICFLRGQSIASGVEKENVSQIGERFCGNRIVSVINNGGQVRFDFRSSTSGSALIVTGMDGKVRRIDELPRGVAPEIDLQSGLPTGRGFFGMFSVPNAGSLPLLQEQLNQWRSLEFVQALAK